MKELRTEVMCHNIRIESQTKNGIVVSCTDCDKYQVLFKNLNFNFEQHEYDSFIKYLSSIDSESWELEYKNSIYSKRIPIPTAQQNLMILVNTEELLELKTLLIRKKQCEIKGISWNEINYNMIYN